MRTEGAGDAELRRDRRAYAAAAIVVIGTGLLWRSGWLPLTPFATKYGGDALWALVVFLGVAWVMPRSSGARVAWVALGVAWAVEFLQLYHAGWIDRIRSHGLGRLVLGTTFNAPDLIAYAVGIALGAMGEKVLFRAGGAVAPEGDVESVGSERGG